MNRQKGKLVTAEADKIKMQQEYEKFKSIASQILFLIEAKEDELKVFTTKAFGIS